MSEDTYYRREWVAQIHWTIDKRKKLCFSQIEKARPAVCKRAHKGRADDEMAKSVLF